MRAVVQRVIQSSVSVDGKVVGQIGRGFNVLLGIGENDTINDIDYMVEKITNLRIFEDQEGKMNLSLLDLGYEMLVISQFTLYGDCRKGRRPSFIEAARPEKADSMYQDFVERVKNLGVKVETGIFQADMRVEIINDGPVTIIIDSNKIF